jgi:ribosomal 50S subunit-recycling heat shock protein
MIKKEVTEMRIDKYLKVSRLIKRRTVAKEMVDGGTVSINGKDAKPSSEIKVGDQVFLRLGKHRITFEVLAVSESATKANSSEMYKIIKDEVV